MEKDSRVKEKTMYLLIIVEVCDMLSCCYIMQGPVNHANKSTSFVVLWQLRPRYKQKEKQN